MEEFRRWTEKGWLPLTIFGLSFLRYILEMYGLDTEQGLFLIADDERQSRAFIDIYCKKTFGNGTRVEVKKIHKEKVENYCASFAVLHSETSEQVDAYLDKEGFLPIIISGGILSEKFRNGYSLLRITDRDMNYLKSSQFHEDVAEFREYVIRNVGKVSRVVKNVEESMDFNRKREVVNQELFVSMLAFSEVYRAMLEDNYGEKSGKEFRKWYINQCVVKLNAIAEFSDGHDLHEIVYESVWKNLKNDQIKVVRHVKEVDATSLELYDESKAIFYDESFYYFNEKHFRVMCLTSLDCFSWQEFKVLLAEDELIERYSNGFTTKKNLYPDGKLERIRCIKMNKELLNSPEDGLLEDYLLTMKKEVDDFE